jgi:hypothetical protein
MEEKGQTQDPAKRNGTVWLNYSFNKERKRREFTIPGFFL